VVALLLTHEALTTAPQAVLSGRWYRKDQRESRDHQPIPDHSAFPICMNLSGMAAFAAWQYRTLFNIECPSSVQI
jgi:hypothetical protein